MYNQEIKERFFSASKKYESKRRFLDKLAQSEESFGLDICQLNREQAIEAIRRMNTYDLGTYDNYVAASKVYAKWCYNNGLFKDSAFGVLGISAQDINPQEFLLQYIYQNEESLIKNLSEIVPLYEGQIGVITCIFAWLGIEDPLSVHDEDVLLESRKILRDDKVIVSGFSDFVYDFFVQYKGLKTSTRENGTTVYPVVRDNSYNNFIKQYCSVNSTKLGKKLELRNVQNAVNKLNDRNVEAGNPPRITYRNIMKSGSLARLYAAEQNGLRVFDRENKEIVEGFFYQSDYRSIVWLYRHYKEAFSL